MTPEKIAEYKKFVEYEDKHDACTVVIDTRVVIDLLALAEVHAPVEGVLTHDEKAVELYRRVWADVVAVCPNEAPPLEALTRAESAAMRAMFSSMVAGISVMLSARTAGAGRPAEAGGVGE